MLPGHTVHKGWVTCRRGRWQPVRASACFPVCCTTQSDGDNGVRVRVLGRRRLQRQTPAAGSGWLACPLGRRSDGARAQACQQVRDATKSKCRGPRAPAAACSSTSTITNRSLLVTWKRACSRAAGASSRRPTASNVNGWPARRTGRGRGRAGRGGGQQVCWSWPLTSRGRAVTCSDTLRHSCSARPNAPAPRSTPHGTWAGP